MITETKYIIITHTGEYWRCPNMKSASLVCTEEREAGKDVEIFKASKILSFDRITPPGVEGTRLP